MTTPEQKHQKSETMKDLYQKPELRFVEVSKQEDGETSIEVMVGDAQVGSVEMTPPGGEDGDWFVIAVYYDHVGQACEQEDQKRNRRSDPPVGQQEHRDHRDAKRREKIGQIHPFDSFGNIPVKS